VWRKRPVEQSSNRVRDVIKNVLAAVLHRTGILSLVVRNRMRSQGVVLMYHRVLPPEVWRQSYSADAIVVTPQTFADHLATIAKYLKPVSPQEFAERLIDPQHALAGHCLITFDDGWYDNHDYALPLLERHRVPAVIYIATDYIGTQNTFWQERLARMLHRLWQARVAQNDLYDELGMHALLAQTDASVRFFVRAGISALKTRSQAEIDGFLQRTQSVLRQHALPDDEIGHDRFMTWQQVGRLHASDMVTVGSHAQSHTPMTKLTPQDVARELHESQAVIAQQIKFATPWFAYPNGDHDATSRQLAQQAGYRMAVTTEIGGVHSGDDPMRLRRISIHEKAAPTPARLLCKVAGLF